MKNQNGIAALAVIGIVAVGSLFVAYVTGHPLPWNTNEFKKTAVVEPVATPAPVVEVTTTLEPVATPVVTEVVAPAVEKATV